MSRLRARSVLLVGTMLLALAPAARARRGVPPTIELDGCVLPSTSCGATRDVVEMIVGRETRRFAVERLRFATSGGSTSRLLSELKLRPLHVQGPNALTGALTPGPRRRVRGTLRLGPPYLLLQAVEPLGERP